MKALQVSRKVARLGMARMASAISSSAAAKIEAKLKSGLPSLAKAPITRKSRDAQRSDQPRRRAETRTPSSPVAQ